MLEKEANIKFSYASAEIISLLLFKNYSSYPNTSAKLSYFSKITSVPSKGKLRFKAPTLIFTYTISPRVPIKIRITNCC